MSVLVEECGGLVTVQDRGRPGLAHLGVPRAGALDRPAADLANRVLGNAEGAAVLEVTMGSLALRATSPVWACVAGAPCDVSVDGAARSHAEAVWVPAGAVLRVGPPRTGVRCYVALSGGVAVEPVLGSRSTDTLAWVGPPRVGQGTELPLGQPRGAPVAHETPRPPVPGPLRVASGPRADWFAADALARLCSSSYSVSPDSNRIALRLDGPALPRTREDELPSEGLVVGAVQVPRDGRPVVFLADHPTTGGYPVIGVVRGADLWQCGQLRPGEPVRFAREGEVRLP